MKTISVGHTPDMDDAFMFYAIASGAIPMNGLRFEHVIEDIQTLNQRALKAQLDMTAISAASYPALADTYWIVSVGSASGRATARSSSPSSRAVRRSWRAAASGCRGGTPRRRRCCALLCRRACRSKCGLKKSPRRSSMGPSRPDW